MQDFIPKECGFAGTTTKKILLDGQMDPMNNCLKPGDRHLPIMALPFQSSFLYARYYVFSGSF